jgi:hypothetical protein
MSSGVKSIWVTSPAPDVFTHWVAAGQIRRKFGHQAYFGTALSKGYFSHLDDKEGVKTQ